jgi:hypothetical protein
VKGRVLKIPPLPGPLPQFFASILPSNNTLSLRKKSRERGQLGDVQLSTKHQAPSTMNHEPGTRLPRYPPIEYIGRSGWMKRAVLISWPSFLAAILLSIA